MKLTHFVALILLMLLVIVKTRLQLPRISISTYIFGIASRKTVIAKPEALNIVHCLNVCVAGTKV